MNDVSFDWYSQSLSMLSIVKMRLKTGIKISLTYSKKFSPTKYIAASDLLHFYGDKNLPTNRV